MNASEGRNLKLGGFHGDGYADEKDTGHCNGGVTPPVLGPTVGASKKGPHIFREISIDMPMLASSHD